MSCTAVRIDSVTYDARARQYQATVACFAPGLATPLRIRLRLDGPQTVSHARLVRGMLHAANRAILAPGIQPPTLQPRG